MLEILNGVSAVDDVFHAQVNCKIDPAVDLSQHETELLHFLLFNFGQVFLEESKLVILVEIGCLLTDGLVRTHRSKKLLVD